MFPRTGSQVHLRLNLEHFKIVLGALMCLMQANACALWEIGSGSVKQMCW